MIEKSSANDNIANVDLIRFSTLTMQNNRFSEFLKNNKIDADESDEETPGYDRQVNQIIDFLQNHFS